VTSRGLAAVVIVSALILDGCGGTTLDVRYPERGVNRALLASVAPRRVQIDNVIDRRLATARVGVEPGGGSDIVTSRSVADIVQEALGLEMSKNGHLIVSERPDVVLRPAVEVFSLDAVEGYPSVQYVGKVVIALTVADGRTGDVRLIQRYVGIRRHEVDKPDKSQWRDVMDTALARAMHDLATDQSLVAALGGTPPAAGQIGDLSGERTAVRAMGAPGLPNQWIASSLRAGGGGASAAGSGG
jgi:YajG family uncharacterized lipoprotein